MKKIASRLTYANVVATLALFIALGGASYAAIKLPKNSVGAKQIRNGAVTGAKIRNGAVTASKIAPGSITPASIDPATLGTVPKATNATNATHATSADRATSADSATSAGNAQTVGGKSAAQIAASAKLTCPSGMKLEMGLCFETTPRAAGFLSTAVATCTVVGRWLPDVEQIIAFQSHNYEAPQPEEWSNVLYYNGATEYGFTAHTTSVGSEYGPKAQGESKAYRCVVLPSN